MGVTILWSKKNIFNKMNAIRNKTLKLLFTVTDTAEDYTHTVDGNMCSCTSVHDAGN
jgi:hypothetical protein